MPLLPKSDTGKLLWEYFPLIWTTHLFSENGAFERVPSPAAEFPSSGTYFAPACTEITENACTLCPTGRRDAILGFLILAQQPHSSCVQVLGTTSCISWCQGSCWSSETAVWTGKCPQGTLVLPLKVCRRHRIVLDGCGGSLEAHLKP